MQKTKLLIERDPVALIPWTKPDGIKREAKVIVEGEMPEELKKPLIVDPRFINIKLKRDLRELPVKGKFLPETIERYRLAPVFGECTPAVWSGYRSVLYCKDWINGAQLFKLKGISFTHPLDVRVNEDDDGYHVYVQGGQLLGNVINEKEYSDQFNRVLKNCGIEPVSECVGFYHWPLKAKGKRLATSIMKVQGDTRLDELLCVIENLVEQRFPPRNGIIYLSEDLITKLNLFYFTLGQSVGQLKKIMDINGQTWSDNPQRTNAHIGNIVLYHNSQNKLSLGLTDFDASCDRRDMRKKALMKQQEVEYQTMMNSAMQGAISLRNISMLNHMIIHLETRTQFVEGFKDSYESFAGGLSATLDNSVAEFFLKELMDELLKEIPQSRSSSGSSSLERKIEDMYGVNKGYNNIIGSIKDIYHTGYGNSLKFDIGSYTGRKRRYNSSYYVDDDDISIDKNKYVNNYI